MRRAFYFAAGFIVLMAVCYGVSYAYSSPDPAKATLVFEEKQLVADADPPTEILIRTYKAADGGRFREYSVRGRVFRYDMDEDGIAPYEYRLLDADGDREFETREEMVGEMAGKGKGQRYFIDLGPEPGKEYRYSYEKRAQEPLSLRDEAKILEGRSIFIPTWVLAEF